SSHLSKLLDIRLKFINLNNEARVRDLAQSRRELAPPLDVRLDNARDELKVLSQSLSPTPMNVNEADWNKFKQHLQDYIKVTEDRRDYNLHGFDRYKDLDDDLNKLIPDAQKRYESVGEEMM